MLAQHVGPDLTEDGGTVLGLLNLFATGPYSLNVMIGDTRIVYGEVFSAALALALVAGTAVVVARLRAGSSTRARSAPHEFLTTRAAA